MQEVEALADRALEVNEDFERIRVALGKVDEKNYKDKGGKQVDKFQPTWIGYKKVRVVPVVSFVLLRNSFSVGLSFSGLRVLWVTSTEAYISGLLHSFA